MKWIKNKIVKGKAVDFLDFQYYRLFLERNLCDKQLTNLHQKRQLKYSTIKLQYTYASITLISFKNPHNLVIITTK